MAKSFKEISVTSNKKLLIVDSLNLGFRWKHNKSKDFMDGFMRTVESLAKSYQCGKIILATDMGASSYRKAIYPEYKANRAEKFAEQTEAEAEEFMAFMEEMNAIYDAYVELGTYPLIRFKNVEADDIVAYIVKKSKNYAIDHIWLISSDRDYDLLVSDKVSRFSYVTSKEITVENWNEHYDYAVEDHISIKCLQGDAGDNVPGVKGIGPKKAKALVDEYGSTYDIIANLPINSKYKYIADLNSFGAENLLRNYKLMDLVEFSEEAVGEENSKIIDKILDSYLEKK